MIDWLRALADRPIADHERRRAFAFAVAVLAAAIGMLLLTRGPAAHHVPATSRAPAPAAQPTASPPTADRQPPAGTALPAGAKAAARRFLAGYLAYLYGHAPARAIHDATSALRRRLTRERPRISPATRRRRGRIVSLTARALEDGRFAVTATIADGGVARYPLGVLLARRGGRWQTTALSGD